MKKQFLVETAGNPRIIEADNFVFRSEENTRYAHFVFTKDGETVAVIDGKYAKAITEV